MSETEKTTSQTRANDYDKGLWAVIDGELVKLPDILKPIRYCMRCREVHERGKHVDKESYFVSEFKEMLKAGRIAIQSAADLESKQAIESINYNPALKPTAEMPESFRLVSVDDDGTYNFKINVSNETIEELLITGEAVVDGMRITITDRH